MAEKTDRIPLPKAMPKIRAYPLCSKCFTPYVLRNCRVHAEQVWSWQPDCEHKTAVPLSSNSPALARMSGQS